MLAFNPPHIDKTAVLIQKKVARDKKKCTAQQSSAKKVPKMCQNGDAVTSICRGGGMSKHCAN